jgi:polar amino acid transport system substrate-binding protein
VTVIRFLLALLLLGLAPARAEDRLALIRDRGEIIVGVKADYPPFGSIDAAGTLVGIEPDLAADLARRLGVGLRLVAVTSASRLQKLEEGSVDVIIATLGDTPERRGIATLLEPAYFVSGANVMLRPDAKGIDDWTDLRGRRLCATLGALFNPEIAQRHLLAMQTFKDNRDAKMALRDGRCIGWLYDDVAILDDLRDASWQGYAMSLPSVIRTPWAVALAKAAAGGPLERAISDIIVLWHREGVLLETMRRWGMPESDYLVEQQELWTRLDADGQPFCRREPSGHWRPECRQETRLTVEDLSGLARLSLQIRERTGLDFSFFRSPYEQGQLARGLANTLLLIGLCIAGSLVVGVAGAVAVSSRRRLLAGPIEAIVAFLRMTPPLLQIYIVFFGVGRWVVASWGWTLDGFLVAVVCLSLYAGAANVAALGEAIRLWHDGRLAADAGWRDVLRLAWPAIMASCVNIAKATGIASAIAVPELILASSNIVAQNGNATVMMNLLMLVYFLLVLGVVWLFTLVERRLARR